jgi:hypothetical protein
MMVVPFCGMQTGVQIDHHGKNTYNAGNLMVGQRSDGDDEERALAWRQWERSSSDNKDALQACFTSWELS